MARGSSSRGRRSPAGWLTWVVVLAVLVVVAHVTHHLDWTTLQVIGPQGLQLGRLHVFIH